MKSVGSIRSGPSACRHSSELPAKASRATVVNAARRSEIGRGCTGGTCAGSGEPDYTPAMNRTRRLPLLLAFVAVLLLAGCGNKGELVRPSDVPETPASS